MNKNVKGFDFSVHKLNKKGQIVRTQPYRLVIAGGVRKFERPPGSGMWYDESNVLISKKKEGSKPEMEKSTKDKIVDELLKEEVKE